LGAKECLFGKKPYSILDCDSCAKYGEAGCVFSKEDHVPSSTPNNIPESRKSAKLSIEEFYNITPAGKLLQSDQAARHPERMPGSNKISATLVHSGDSPANTNNASKSPHIKRAKWHLGIRSQSRPEDIMYEVFRAMKYLDFEWKLLNAYHVVVRRKPKDPDEETPKMSLQLYQVDQRSYLLDFKNLQDDILDLNSSSSRHASVSTPVKPSLRNNRAQSLPMPIAVERAVNKAHMTSNQSQTMQFFEMCAALIGALAR
jgi:5'-AMP-activated protein kinase catalytic alpha subunit